MENTRLTLCHRYSFISRSASQNKKNNKKKTSWGREREGKEKGEREREGWNYYPSLPNIQRTHYIMEPAISLSDVGCDVTSAHGRFETSTEEDWWNFKQRSVLFIKRQRSFVICPPCERTEAEEELRILWLRTHFTFKFAHRRQENLQVSRCCCLVSYQPMASNEAQS